MMMTEYGVDDDRKCCCHTEKNSYRKAKCLKNEDDEEVEDLTIEISI